eukprot:6212477-Pleurochrysis_carterae.AAC.4
MKQASNPAPYCTRACLHLIVNLVSRGTGKDLGMGLALPKNKVLRNILDNIILTSSHRCDYFSCEGFGTLAQHAPDEGMVART